MTTRECAACDGFGEVYTQRTRGGLGEDGLEYSTCPLCGGLGRFEVGTLLDRFSSKVDVNGPTMPHMTTPCHVWTGRLTRKGYGAIGVDGIRSHKMLMRGAHRVAFFLHHGRWPEPCACHHCDNPACVRWDHLFEGSNAENTADRDRKGRTARGERNAKGAQTHCIHGHPFDDANTYVCRDGSRMCRRCRADRQAVYDGRTARDTEPCPPPLFCASDYSKPGEGAPPAREPDPHGDALRRFDRLEGQLPQNRRGYR